MCCNPDFIDSSTAIDWDINNHRCLALLDQYTLSLCYKWLDRVVQLCQQPRLQLKVSPPYLLDILPDLYETLQAIVSRYQNDCSALYEIDYFRIFVHSLIQRSEHTVRLFRETGDSMFDSQSLARHRLAKSALVFSHLLHDLRALFPNNIYVPAFRITKPDAAKWWQACFGTKTIVPWTQFHQAFRREFNVNLSETRLRALRNTIDLTCNLHVSIFEFDLFSRLFQPWCNIIDMWTVLALKHPGYMAFMTYDEVKATLKPFRTHPGPGTYVFRLSCTKPGQWAIGYITEDRKIIQTIIQNKSLAQALLDGEQRGFYLYPNGQHVTSDLIKQLVNVVPQPHVRVTREQYQMYRDMGSTFEVCKICDEHNKDIQLEPCGHLICKQCLLHCQSASFNRTCPFCRLEIKGIEEVVVDPYRPKSDTSESPILPTVKPATTDSDSRDSDTSPVLDVDTDDGPDVISCASIISAPRNPPPVPPRNLPSSLHPSCYAATDPQCLINESSTVVSSAEPGVGSFSYPQMMYADGCCLTPAPNRTGGDAAVPSSHLQSTPSQDEQDGLSRPSTAFNLNYAQLDLLHSESDSDSLGPVTSGLKNWAYHQRECAKSIETVNVPLNHSVLSDSTSSSHNCVDSHISSSVDDSLVHDLMAAHSDMERSDAVLLLSITHNDLSMADRIWYHFTPRSKLPPSE